MPAVTDTESHTVLDTVTDRFPMAITPQILKGIQQEGPGGPLAKQFLPDLKELMIDSDELSDPVGDEQYTVQKGVVHRYPDRCLLKPVSVCAVYCRFCFRRETLGGRKKGLTPTELEAAFQYISEHKEIWEVIITGGDPFILKPKKIAEILSNLENIPHVEVIRIHTRIPFVDPGRMTEEIFKALNLKKTLYIALHANHPSEFTDEAKTVIAKLSNQGIPLMSQTVLLKGINDNINTLSELMRTFVKHKIKPYYLHHLDLVQGTSHFRTSVEKGIELMKALRGHFSGLCQPTYVIDLPGGYGKVPVSYSYIKGDKIEDYQGKCHPYPHLTVKN